MDTLARLLVYPFIHLFANTDTLCPPYLAQIFFFFDYGLVLGYVW